MEIVAVCPRCAGRKWEINKKKKRPLRCKKCGYEGVGELRKVEAAALSHKKYRIAVILGYYHSLLRGGLQPKTAQPRVLKKYRICLKTLYNYENREAAIG